MASPIPAVLAAQWRVFRNPRPASGRVGRILRAAVWVVWYGIWVGVGATALLLARVVPRPQLALGVPWALLAITLYWQLAPVLTANLGAAVDLKKLLVYPISDAQLFSIDLLLRAATSIEMLLALGGLTAGLAANPAVPAWAPLAGAALLAGFNLFLAVGLRSLMERLMGIRRLREAFALVFILCAALPQLLRYTGVPHGLRRVALTPPSAWLPPSAAARVVLGESPAASAAVALLWMAAAYWFARRQFRRSLRFDSAAALARGARGAAGAGWSERIYGLPALLAPDPLAALIQKELRSLARSPRFRVLLLMGLTFGMVVWLPVASRGGHVSENYPLYVSFYAVVLTAEVIIWNQFGFDRGATQLYFIAPVGMRQVLRAKNAAAVLFILLEVALVLVLCLALRVRLTGAKVIEIYAVILVGLLYFLAAGNLSSLYQPRAMDPERTWGRGASSRFQWQAVLLLPVLLAPLGLAYLARYALKSQAAFYLVLAVDALVGLAAYHFALDRAVRASERRKEQLLAALSQGSGPIVVE